jgi:2-methylcitrate dehydratase PrpD
MGIAGSQAAGLRENFGTMMKPFHAGHAAEVGVFSADLTSLGWTAADGILESPRGFFHAYGGSYDPNAIIGRLKNPWTFANPGVSIKPFPSGSLTHPAMDAVMKLIKEHDIKAAEVEQVYVGTNRQNPNALIHHEPKNALQAKFSMEFCVAILLLEGKAGLNEFTDQVVNRPDVQATIKKVKFAADPEAEAAGYDKMTSIIKIRLKDGRTISGRADFAKGSPSNPMSYNEVADKFMDCCKVAGWPAAKADQIVQVVSNLETLPSISSLATLCSQ